MRELVLRPYQEGLRDWALERPRAGLLADMGLGKTPTALAVIQASLEDYLDTSRWLVVAPKLVASDTWPRQLRAWRQFQNLDFRHLGFDLLQLKADTVEVDGKARRVGLTFGTAADKREAKARLLALRETIHLCSWDLLAWLVKAYGSAWPYDGLVLDESLNAQGSTTDRHRAAYHVVHRLGKVHRVIILTGTPAPGGYEQLHGQLRLLDGGERLGDSKTSFYERFMVPGRRGPTGIVFNWKLAPGARETIDAKVGELCVSLKSDDYLQLPPQVINPVWVTLPPAAREAYDTLERDLLLQIGDTEILAPNQGVAVSKLLQIANGTVYDAGRVAHPVHDEKLEKLSELIESVSGPLLLAYPFQSDWRRLEARFGALAGHVTAPGALDRFRKGKLKLLCMQPAGSSEGLDGLQDVSSNAVWFGACYSARHWLQFNARLRRDGQRAGRVVIHQILAEGTIEEYVAGRVLPDRVEAQDVLLDALRLRVSACQNG